LYIYGRDGVGRRIMDSWVTGMVVYIEEVCRRCNVMDLHSELRTKDGVTECYCQFQYNLVLMLAHVIGVTLE
jgi:hypothetical protein